MNMNSLRVLLNISLSLLLLSGGVYLLGQNSIFLRDRWNPGIGTLFQGSTLYLLAFGLILFGAFSGAVAYAWIKGSVPMPGQGEIRPHPGYKGAVIIKFWYLVLPAVLFLLLAFLLADKAPNPSLQPRQQSSAAELTHSAHLRRHDGKD